MITFIEYCGYLMIGTIVGGVAVCVLLGVVRLVWEFIGFIWESTEK